MSRWIGAFLWAVFGGAAIAMAMFAAIMRSASSTAAIGILFIPFAVVPFSILFFIFGYCFPDLIECFQRTALPHSLWLKFRAAIAVLLAVCGIGYLAYGMVFTSAVIHVHAMNEPQLRQFLDRSVWRHNRFALGAFAENPHASAAMLDEVAHYSDPALHDRMDSVLPVMGNNRRGLAVMRLIARHPNVSQATLVHLAHSPDEYVRGDVVSNSKTPTSVIREIAVNGDLVIQMGLAYNRQTPPDLLSDLATSKSQYVRFAVAQNPSTPVETLVKLASDTEPLVRRDVALNLNTPQQTVARLANDSDERVRLGVKVRSGLR